MNPNPRLLIGAVSALALTLSFAVADVAVSQTPATRQIAVEPDVDKTPAADAAKTERKTAPEDKTVVVPDIEKPAADATKAENKVTPEKKAAAVAEEKQPAAAAKQVEKGDGDKKAAVDGKALAPADKADAPPAELGGKDLVLALQTELKRVGCYLGPLDGIWGPQSRSALDAFGYFGRIELDDPTPSAAWIKHVKGKTKTVCHESYGDTGPYDGYGYGAPHPGGYPGGGYDRY